MSKATSKATSKVTSEAMKVIAISNQKGGVAKTTSVVSLGGALVRQNQEVLLVDLDAQANLTLAVGKDPARMRSSVAEVFFNAASLISVSRETAIPGLDLVPANAGMSLAERFLPVRKDYETLLRRAILDLARAAGQPAGNDAATGTRQQNPQNGNEPILSLSADLPEAYPTTLLPGFTSPPPPYDYILIDCPPALGAVTLNALAASNLLIIPTQPEYFSAHALRRMMDLIRQVRSQHNPELAYRILITMYDRRNRIHQEVSEQIREAFGEAVFNTVIEVDTKLRESAVEGLPITHHRSSSRSALQYDALAKEIIAYERSDVPNR
jgi:chromosome partitioning protein